METRNVNPFTLPAKYASIKFNGLQDPKLPIKNAEKWYDGFFDIIHFPPVQVSETSTIKLKSSDEFNVF